MSDEESDIDDKLFPDLGSSNQGNTVIRVRFVNRCLFPVDVFWLNFEKQPTKYGTLRYKQYLDVTTFKNHPWVARRSYDGAKLKVNDAPIFWPEPAMPNFIVRPLCDITTKVRTLKEIASRSLVHQNPKMVPEDLVNLPRDLQYDVEGFLKSRREYLEIVCRAIPAPRARLRPPAQELPPPTPPPH